MPTKLRYDRQKGRKGVVLMITALMMLFIVLPAVGLAIDGAVLYSVRARLQNATDGAAIAAARSLSRGLNMGQQEDSATQTAVKYYNANIDATWPGLSTPDPAVSFPASSTLRTKRIQVSATVEAPTYFMKVLNKNSVVINSVSEAVRRDVNIMMVLDRSGSLEQSGSCDDLREAAKGFVNSFVDGRDRIGLITFGTSYRVDFAMAHDFKSKAAPNDMQSIINNIICVGGTNSAAAYWLGYQQFLANPEPGVLNVILFFTDGRPNTLTLNQLDPAAGSGCASAGPFTGVLTPAGSQVWGIFRLVEPNAPPATNPDWVQIGGINGCNFAGTTSTQYQQVSTGLQGLSRTGTTNGNPNEVDIYGNALVGYKTPVNRNGLGRLAVDSTTVTNAGINALDSAASRVRAATSGANGLNVTTFAVALGTPTGVEEELLQRVANVPASPIYNSSQPTGLYIRADNPSQLDEAFAQLASDVMRLSK